MSWSPPGIWNPSVGVITPWSAESLGIPFGAMGLTSVAASNWPSANLAIYIPFEVARASTVTAAAYYSNATTGNTDIGVYNAAGTRLVSSGSTAAASGWTTVDLTDTLLQPGRYYMAFVRSALASTFRSAPSSPIDTALGVKQQASALPLPSTATFADASNGYIPAIALALTTVGP